MGKVKLEQGRVTPESVRFQRLLDLLLMEVDRSLRPNYPRSARVYSILTRRTRRTSARNAITTIRRPPTAPSFERTHTSGDEAVARKRALVGDSLNDEQWGDDLFNASSQVGDVSENRSREKMRT